MLQNLKQKKVYKLSDTQTITAVFPYFMSQLPL